MMRKILLMAILGAISMQTKAQYDVYMNQMFMYQQQRQYDELYAKILSDAFDAEKKRRDAMASASCIMFPQENDRFYAVIPLAYISASNIKILIENESGLIQTVKQDYYTAINDNIITGEIFEPGTTIYIRRKDTNKVLTKVSIPSKESLGYAQYVKNCYISSQNYLRMMSGSSNGISMPNINSSSTSTVVGQKTCSTCRGKGWIAGFSTPNYGASGQRWCDACQELVNPSHSHDRCPSCRGTGSQPTINVK